MFPQKHKSTIFGPFYARLLYLIGLAVFCFFAIGLFPSKNSTQTVYAATSSTLNFQGRIYNANGSTVPDGYYNLQFKLYDGGTSGGPGGTGQANAGTNLWTESYYDSNGVTAGNDNRARVVNGYFSVNLGSQTAFPSINWDQELWLTMNVGGSTQTATPTYDGEMLAAGNTRTKLTGVPYAFRAGSLQGTAGAYTADDLVQLAPATIQGVNSANNAVRVNQTGAGGLLQLQSSGTDQFTISNTGVVTATGTGTFQGASLTVGTVSQTGSLILNDGSSNTVTLSLAAQGQNSVITIPDPGAGTDTVCLQGLNNCAGASVTLQSAYTASTGSTTPEIKLDSTRGALDIQDADSAINGSLLTVRASNGSGLGAALFDINSTGQTTFKNSADSSTAFQIQNAAGSSLINVDSSQEAANLVTNGSFNQNTTGWTASGAASLSSSTAQQIFGQGSLLISSTAAANDGARYAVTLAPSTTYSLTFYGRASSNAPIAVGRSDDGSTETNCTTSSLPTGGWYKVNCGFTTGGSISSSFIYIKQTDSTARSMYIDGVHLYLSATYSGVYSESKISINGTINTPFILQPTVNSSSTFDVYSASGGSFFNLDTLNNAAQFWGNNFALKGSSTTEFQVGNNTNKALLVDTSNTRVGINIANANLLNTFNINNATTADSAATALISTGATTNKGLVIQGVASQSAALLQAQSSVGGVVASINYDGRITTVQGLQIETSSASQGTILKKVPVGTTGVTAGDVVVLIDNSGTAKIETTTTARDVRVYGVSNNTTSSGSDGYAVIAGNTTVNVDTGAVAIGDQLVTGTSAGRATVDNNATTGIIGTALSSKAGGSNGTVSVAIRPVGGQYSPVFRNASDSTTAFQIQNAAGTSNLFNADTTNSIITLRGGADATVSGGGQLVLGDTTANNLVLDENEIQARNNGAAANLNLNQDGGTVLIGFNTAGALNINNGQVTVNSTGQTLFKNASDSTTAFQVQNAAGTQILNIGTSNSNLITNPSIEINATGWVAHGASTVTRSTSQAYIGNASLQVATTAAANDGARYAVSLSSATSYSLVAWARHTSGSFSTLELGRSEDGSTDTSCSTGNTSSTAGWVRIACTFTTGTVSGSPYIYIKQTDATSRTIYIDAVQLLASSSITPYREGTVQLNGVVTSPTTFQNTEDSSIAFQIQNAAGTSNLFIADTRNGRIGIGTTGPSALLQVSGAGGGASLFKVTDTTSTAQDVLDIADGGAVTFRNQTDSTSALKIVNAANTVNLLVADTSNSRVDFGSGTNFLRITASSGSLFAQNSSAFNTAVTLLQNADSNARFALYYSGGMEWGGGSAARDLNLIRAAAGVLQVSAPSGTGAATLRVKGTSAQSTTNLFEIQPDGSTTNMFSIGASGVLTSRNSSDSTAAFQILNAAGVSNLTVDTTNSYIYVGNPSADAVANFLVIDTKNTTGDPAGVAGAMYYNSFSGKFRCYEAGAWIDCVGAGLGATLNLQTAYTNSAGGTTPEIKVDSTRGGLDIQDADSTIGGNLLTVRASNGGGLGSALFSVNSTGQTLLQNSTNSTSAFRIQNAASSNLFVADTTNMNVGIGTSSPFAQFTVAGKVPTAATGSVSLGASQGPINVFSKGRYVYVTDLDGNNFKIVDVSDPSAPAVISTTNTATNPVGIYVAGGYAYVTNRGSDTMTVYDVSDPTNVPAAIASIATDDQPYDVYVSGRYAYVVHDVSANAKLRIYDITNPAAPVQVSNTTITETAKGIYVQGRYAYIAATEQAFGTGVLEIVDISNPASPSSVGYLDGIGSQLYKVIVKDRYAYVSSNGSSGISVIDIADPTTPTSVGNVATTGGSIDFELQGRYMYVTNFSANALETIDISNVASPVSVGTVTTGTNPRSVAVLGRYAYVANYGGDSIQAFDMGGAYLQQLEVGGIETTTIHSTGNATFDNDVNVAGSLSLGGGAFVGGQLGVNGPVLFQNQTNSSGAFAVKNAAGNTRLSLSTNSNEGLKIYGDSNDEIVEISANTGLQVATTGTTAWTNLGTNNSSNILNLYNASNASVGSISATGAVLFNNSTDSATAFQIQNAIGSNALVVGTSPLNTLINNGSIENATITEWASKQNATVTRSTAEQYIGNASISAVLGGTTAANDGIKYTPSSALSATTYMLTFYIKQTAGTAFGTNLAVGWNNGADSNCTLSPSLSTLAVPTTGWARYSCTFTGSAGGSDHIYFKQTDAPASARTFFIDAVQLEATATTVSAFQESTLALNGVITSPLTLRNSSNSTTGLQIQGASGNDLLTYNTITGQLRLNNGGSSARLTIAPQNGGTQNLWNLDNQGGTFRIFKEDYTASGGGPNGLVALSIDNSANATFSRDVVINGGDLTSTAATFNLLNNSTASTTLNIGTTAGNTFTQAINIGTSATAGSTTNVTIGSTIAGLTTLQSQGGVAITTLGAADNATYLCRNSSNIIAACNTTGVGAAFVQGGNSFGATATLGTNDSNSLVFETNNATQATIAVGGATTFKNSADSAASFNIQNVATNVLFNVDTSANTVTLGAGGSSTYGSTINIANTTNGTTPQNVNIGSNANVGSNVNIKAGTSGGINLGSTGSSVASSTTNIGNTSDGTGTQTVNIGSTANASNAVLIQGGTGASAISLQAGSGGTIGIGSSAVAQTLNIGNITGATAVNINSGTGGSTITSTGTGDITLTSGDDVVINGGGANAAISIGTVATAHTITIGNVTGATGVIINSGTGGTAITSTGTGDITAASADTLLLDAVGVLELNSSGGVISIGNDAVAQNINVGTGAAARTITLGNVTGATAVNINTGTGGSTTTTTGTGDIVLNSADTVLIDAAGVLELNSSGGVISIGNDAVAQNINVGTGAAARTLTIGNVTGATALNLRTGTGNFTLDGVAGTTYTLGASTTTGTFTLGGTAQTGAITLGSSSGTNSVLIGNGAGATTVSIANANTAGAVNVGAAFTTGTITVGGTAQTGNMILGQSTATNTIAIGASAGNGNTQTINIGTSGTSGSTTNVNIGSAINGSTIVKGNSATAFQVQNAASANLLTVDATGSGNISLLANNNGALNGWTTNANNLAISASDGVVASYNGYIYYVSGYNSGSIQDDYQYARINTDGSVGTWTNVTSNQLPGVRYAAGGTAVNGYMYIIGGSTTTSSTNVQTTVYYARINADGTLGAWQTNSNTLCAGIYGNSVVSLNGYIYSIGGMNSGGVHQTTTCYAKLNADGSTGAWTTTGTIPAGRSWGSVNVANGYLYFVGGMSSGTANDDTYYGTITPSTGAVSWAADGDLLPTNRATGALGVMNGYLYYVAGDDLTNSQDDVYYAALNANGTINAWSTDGLLTANRSGGGVSAVVANGYIYYVGGATGGTQQTSVYYASGARVRIGGNLDLVGLSGENLNAGGSGGNLTAGNTRIIGTLDVQGDSAIRGNLFAGGNVTLRNGTNSTSAFQIQNASGTTIFSADTTNSRIGINTTTASYDLSFGGDSARTIGLQTRSTNAAGSALTISAGTAGAGGSAFAGGTLTLQGGSAGGTGNANGGDVTITGGAGTGATGYQGLVYLSSTAFSTAAVQTISSTGVQNITAGNQNIYSTLPITASVSGVIAVLGDPGQTSVIGRILYVTARSGSNDFTLRLNSARTPIDITMKANSTATLIWNGTDWTAAGASSSTDLQAAYNNTVSSAGGAELILNAPGGAADGLTIRNNGTTPITGGLLEVQTSIGSNLLTVNNNATEYANNGGAESTTFTMWTDASAGALETTGRDTSNVATGQGSVSIATTAVAAQGVKNTLSSTLTNSLEYQVSFTAKAASTGFSTLDVMYSYDGTVANARHCVAGTPTYTGTASQSTTTITGTGFTAAMTGMTIVFANGQSSVVTYVNATTLTASISQTVSSQSYGLYPAGFTVNTSTWTRVSCNFTAAPSGTTITSSNAIFIRQTDATSRTFYVDNLSVTVNADVNHAADGSVDNALGTNWTQFDADGGAGTTTVTRDTTNIYDTSGAVSDVTTAHVNEGVRNNMTITPSINTQYLVTFYAKSTNNFSDITVGFLPAGGNSVPLAAQRCTDYNTQSVSTSSWTRITCVITTPGSGISDPDLVIYQPTATARTFYIDALTIALNTNNSSNVQIGGGNKGGPTTLFTLDRSNGAPIGANNDAYLGSMYYDTITGRIQCYEADGWGACGAAPDNIVNLNPEYAGAVLNGTGVGTMTADFCSNQSGVLQVNNTLCSTGEAKNFYKWTSPQATQQTYSIYVTYQLPATFNGFSSDDTVQLVGRVDNTTNASVTYEMYKSTGSAVTQCGSGETNVITGGGGSANTWYSYGINGNESTGCSFNSSSAGNFVIFKINLKANSSANAYVSTLSFVTTGR